MCNSKTDEKMTKEQLIADIQNAIKTNGNHDITGPALQTILVEMVNTIYAAMQAPSGEPTYEGYEGSLIVQNNKKRGEASKNAILVKDGLDLFAGEGEVSAIYLRGGSNAKNTYKIYVDESGTLTADVVIE